MHKAIICSALIVCTPVYAMDITFSKEEFKQKVAVFRVFRSITEEFKKKLAVLRENNFLYQSDYLCNADDEIEKYQRNLWRLGKQYDNQCKQRTALMPLSVCEAVKKYAQEKISQSLTFDQVSDIIKKQKETKKTDTCYISIPIIHTLSDGTCNERYLVKDWDGNYTVYRKKIKKISPTIEHLVEMNRVAWGKGEYLTGKRVDFIGSPIQEPGHVYASHSIIEVYDDKVGSMDHSKIIMLRNPDQFLEVLKQGDKKAAILETMGFADKAKNITQQCSKIVNLGKALLKESNNFYEAWSYLAKLKINIKNLDKTEKKNKGGMFTFLGNDGIEEFYACQCSGKIYVFGALLESDAHDSEYDIDTNGVMRKFADKIFELDSAELSEFNAVQLDTEHLSEPEIKP